MAELVATGLVVERGDPAERALAGIDLRIERGELVAIMGATGAGKSTLACALAGLEPLAAGRVEGDAAGQVRLVLQRPEATFLADTVVAEVALAAEVRGEPGPVAARHALGLLERLGIDPALAGRDPLTLSGGEQRRVAIAAALAADPRVLVLDEPAAGLDGAARELLHGVVRTMHAEGRTLVLVTHDPDEAAQLATRLVVLRDGRIAWDGPPASLLGDPSSAAAVGLAVAPEVELLHDVARARGLDAPRRVATRAGAVRALAQQLATSSPSAGVPPVTTREPAASAGRSRAPLPVLVDARVRLAASLLAMVAALVASSLLGAAIVVAATVVVVAAARIDRARVVLTVRPLVMLAVLLVALQLLVGGAPDVDLRRGVPATFDAAPAIMRALQAGAVMFAALALSAATAPLELATGVRRLAAPLRLVGIPVASLAFVVATALGLVPAMADELERLRRAQRARGLRMAGRSPIARLRADVPLVAPLVVAAFRRAHQLADALVVRGIDPRRPVASWRAMTVPSSDLLLLGAGIVLVVVARLA